MNRPPPLSPQRPSAPRSPGGLLKKLLLALGMAAVLVWIVLLIRLLAPDL